jgi:hypothetical protein
LVTDRLSNFDRSNHDIEVMTASAVGKVEVQHLCKLAGVSRASYDRHFKSRAPGEADVTDEANPVN